MRIQSGLLALFLGAAACATPPEPLPVTAPAAVAEQPLVTETRKVVQGFVDKNQFVGAVLVAKDGVAVFSEGFGLANREWNIPNTPDTAFRLGSITKQFTAASILQLGEAGKLSIDDKVSKYYEKAPAAWSAITLKHLLTHRSGIPSYTDLPGFFETQAGVSLSPEGVVELTSQMPLNFEPGTKFEYDNTGYVLLGYVIEKVSSQTYSDYLQEHIFGPLGMKRSGYDNTTDILPGRASGYGLENGKWSNASYLAMTLPHAAGALYSTVGDLLIWEEALFGGKVVSEASLADMLTDHGDGYGYGIGPDDLEGHKAFRHSGGIPGFSTEMARFEGDGLTVISLSNLESARPGRLNNEIARLWLGLPPPPKLAEVKVAPEVLDRYAGLYELTPGFNITISRNDERLMAQATGQDAFALTATSETEFQFQPAGIRIVFPEGDGPSQSFTLFQGGERTAKRIAVN